MRAFLLQALIVLLFVSGPAAVFAAEASSMSETGQARFLPRLRLSCLFEDNEPETAKLDDAETEEKSKSYRLGLPGWWGYEKTEQTSSAAFLPFYYRYAGPEVSIRHFWPFYGRKTRKFQYDTHYALWPFLRYTRYESGSTQVDMPWPFLQVYGGSRVFHVHLFPLIWADIGPGDKGSVVLFPVFWHFIAEKSRTTIFLPVYWDIRTPEVELRHVWPLYGYSKAAGWHRQMLGFPLLRYTRRWDPDKPVEDQPADRQIDFLWPFVKLRLGPMHKQFHLFPFYFGKTYYRDKEDGKTKLHERYFWALPFFWYQSNRYATYLQIWPYGISRTRDGDERRIDIAWPLLSIHTIKSTEVLEISIPFLLSIFKYESRPTVVHFKDHSTKGRSVSVRLFPFLSYRKSPAVRHLSVNPLFTYNRQLSQEQEAYIRLSVVGGLVFLRQSLRSRLSWQFLVRIATYDRSEDGEKRLRFLWWTCKWGKGKSYYQFQPIFRYTADEDGYDFRLLTGLFGVGREKDKSYTRLFWVKF